MVMADLIIMVDQMVTVLDREMETIMVVVLIDRVVIEIKKKKKQPSWLLFL
jgi:CRISPR/Cas system-associated exonuclease Cas4 (RecB family)